MTIHEVIASDQNQNSNNILTRDFGWIHCVENNKVYTFACKYEYMNNNGDKEK